MIPIRYVEPVFRPPSEAESLILPVTDGCSWNKCTFCEMYTSEQKKFRARDADEVLGRAHAIFRDLGAAVWADRVTAEQARLGLTRSSALVLTPTEARVARLAGAGLSTRDVAAELGISPRTVETHLASLYGKLGVTSRAELGRVMALRETNEPPPGFHG